MEPNSYSPAILSFILALIVQIVGFIWWAAKTAAAVSDLSNRIKSVEEEQRTQDKSMGEMRITMARLDERTLAIVSAIQRVEKRLDKMGVAPE